MTSKGRDSDLQSSAAFPDNSIRELTELEIYPGLPETPNASPGHFDIDLGRFHSTPPWSGPGLEPALGVPHAGQLVITAGFPSEFASEAVTYPEAPSTVNPITPAVRFGRLERVTGLDTKASDRPTLLQHDIALVGGFSGSPLIDETGHLLGVVTWSHQVHVGSTSRTQDKTFTLGTSRLVDAGGFNFAVSASYLESWSLRGRIAGDSQRGN